MELEIEKIKNKIENIPVLNAGLPHFDRNFTRDSLISGILMKNPLILKNQLILCSKLQGKKENPKTGEEKGKIFHEFPSFKFENLETKYNACDTTALFIISHQKYFELTKDFSFIKKQKKYLLKAVKYLLLHSKKGYFMEDPLFSKAKEYALKVTYWKDSELISREEGKPIYPISYTLVNAQTICALRVAGDLLNKKYHKIADKMIKKFNEIFYDLGKGFCIAIDKKGKIFGNSSDFLHMLFYLKKGDLSEFQIDKILENSIDLETKFGYRTLSEKEETLVKDRYHSSTIWPFEQAVIHEGSKNFNLPRPQEVSKRITNKIKNDFPELLKFENEEWSKGGCNPQLWTIAASEYFKP